MGLGSLHSSDSLTQCLLDQFTDCFVLEFALSRTLTYFRFETFFKSFFTRLLLFDHCPRTALQNIISTETQKSKQQGTFKSTCRHLNKCRYKQEIGDVSLFWHRFGYTRKILQTRPWKDKCPQRKRQNLIQGRKKAERPQCLIGHFSHCDTIGSTGAEKYAPIDRINSRTMHV